MNFAIYYAILIAFCSINRRVKSQSCQASDGEPGTCLSLHDCRFIVNLIRDGKRRVAYFDDHFSVCLGHGDGQYICCPNMHATTTTSTTTLDRPTDLNFGSGMNGNIFEDVPKFGKIEDVSNHPNLNLLPINCGRIFDATLANALNTSIGEFPFLALLQYETDHGFEFGCGGTIINERYILTSAHCVTSEARRLVSVRVGEYFINTSRDCLSIYGLEFCVPPAEDIEVEAIIPHPRFNRTRFANDIALIRLWSGINFNNSNMNPICLPITTEIQYAPMNNLLTAGWGLSVTGILSDIPLKSIFRVVDRDICQDLYGSIRILESLICAVDVNATETCQTFSGSPLFYPAQLHKFARNVQYGISVGGHRSCGGENNFPNIYTRISHYMKWILDSMVP